VSKLKELIRNFDSVVLGITGLVAILSSILAFVGWFKLNSDQLLQMILAALGLLMISVITQISRRDAAIRELREASGVTKIEWIKNIEEAGIKTIYPSVPRESINAAISSARLGRIRFFFLSYATIYEYANAFHQALEQGCDIEIIIADPVENCVIAFAESSPSYKKNRERQFAEMCMGRLETMISNIPNQYRGKFRVSTYSAPSSIVVIEVLDRIWFGILWCHTESFQGPWFEIQGTDKMVSKHLCAHIDAVKKHEEEDKGAVGSSRRAE